MDINKQSNSKRNFLKSALGLAAIPSLAIAAMPAVSPSRKKGPRADYFPNVLLQTHEGKTVRFYDDLVHNKKVVFSMMYTVCTNICPPSTANLVKVQEGLQQHLGKDIFMYSLSLRPDFDTPSALRDYMKQYDIGPGWTFLTGRAADMEIMVPWAWESRRRWLPPWPTRDGR